MLLALIHTTFSKYFNWKNELSLLSLMNRQMMYIHTLFIAVVLFMMGLLCISSAKEMIETPIGRRVALGFGIFWGLRLVVQFFGYSSELWKGKRFETWVHVVFSLMWVYLTVVFLGTYFGWRGPVTLPQV